MTKAKSKPCICCVAWNGACTKGWKPRFYKDGGLRRVCDDFLIHPPAPTAPKISFVNRVKRLFGVI